MLLIRSKIINTYSKYTIVEFEQELISVLPVKEHYEFGFYKLSYFLTEILSKSVLICKLFKALITLFSKKNLLLSINMGVNPEKLFPLYLSERRKKAAYFFDCWPDRIYLLANLINLYGIDTVFLTSKQAVEMLTKIIPNRSIIWIPEGIKLDNYFYKDYSKKDIDVLQLGRKHEVYHDMIKDYCHEHNIKYLFEQEEGTVILKRNEDFYNGLARTKISICFPASTTHPARCGEISTFTQRFLQSMASKCLILGELPEDMKCLFDYDPIINANHENPTLQISNLLHDFSSYIPLIKRNYNEIVKNHTWKNRIQLMSKYL